MNRYINKIKKTLFLIIYMSLLICAFGCAEKEEPVVILPCEHQESDWLYDDPSTPCGEMAYQHTECILCGEWLRTRTLNKRPHNRVTEIIPATCTENGKTIETCTNCDFRYESIIFATGHTHSKYQEVSRNGDYITKEKTCTVCGETIATNVYVNNGHYKHGKLLVVGPDLVDQDGQKFQLYGVSTHGLQWFGSSIINYEVFEELNMAFSNNVVRLSLYTAEGGYCEASETKKQVLLNYVIDGVKYATEIGMYVIIDWHMVGANDDNDKNPLYYLNESKEFFSYVSEYFKDYDNVLYEIMNEPNGAVTWSMCKEYALEVIPCIRQNSDGIILVGSPSWSTDLGSITKDPIKGYSNIMYTYHFYADDHKDTSKVISAYKNKIPVFISEFGFMYSDGDGKLNITSGENWLKVLDDRNISYVAWNLSNSNGSASILKASTSSYIDFNDSNLKEWGIYLKNLYLKKSGLK